MRSDNIFNEKNNDHTEAIPIFVYGTLMRGQRAAHMLEQYEYVGEFTLKDYALYNVSYYPGIKYAAFAQYQYLFEDYYSRWA